MLLQHALNTTDYSRFYQFYLSLKQGYCKEEWALRLLDFDYALILTL